MGSKRGTFRAAHGVDTAVQLDKTLSVATTVSMSTSPPGQRREGITAAKDNWTPTYAQNVPAQEEAARPQTPLRVVAETVKFAEATAEAAETVTAVKAVRGKSSGALPVDVLTTCRDGQWRFAGAT